MGAHFDSRVIPENVLKCMRPEDRKDLGVATASERDEKIAGREEAAEQKVVENYLRLHGFLPSTADMIRTVAKVGYYIHLNDTRKNPLILDLLILHRDGRYLQIEMKVRDKFQPGQTELIEQGFGKLAWSAAQAIEFIKEWLECCSGS